MAGEPPLIGTFEVGWMVGRCFSILWAVISLLRGNTMAALVPPCCYFQEVCGGRLQSSGSGMVAPRIVLVVRFDDWVVRVWKKTNRLFYLLRGISILGFSFL